MLGAQESYTRAIQHGSWQGLSCSLDGLAEVTPAVIAEQMRRAEAALSETMRGASPEARLRDGRALDQPVQRMIEHETLHHGQLINFLHCHHLPVPESWQDDWALPG